MKPYKIVIFIAAAFFVNNSAFASSRFHFIQDNKSSVVESTEALKKQLQLKLLTYFPPIKTNEPGEPINISFGVKALENSLKQGVRVDIAALITQADVLSLSRQFPQRLKTVQTVINAPLFQCQLDVFKKINHKQPADKQQSNSRTLGILLNNNSRLLLPGIEAYAKKRSLEVAFLVLKNNESITRGFHQLMQHYPTVAIIADNQVNHQSNLEVVFKEAQLMKRTIISSSSNQHTTGVNEDCVFSDEIIIEDVIRRVIEKFNHSTSSSQKSLIPGYQIFLPFAATLNK